MCERVSVCEYVFRERERERFVSVVKEEREEREKREEGDTRTHIAVCDLLSVRCTCAVCVTCV